MSLPCLCCDFCQCDCGSVASGQAGAMLRGAPGHLSSSCHVANIARGEQEGTRHPELPMQEILLVLKPKNIFYTNQGYTTTNSSLYEHE